MPRPPPEDLPDPGVQSTPLTSPALAGRFFTISATWEALHRSRGSSINCPALNSQGFPENSVHLCVLSLESFRELFTLLACGGCPPFWKLPSPPSSMERQSQVAVPPRRQCPQQLGSLPFLPWETQACRDPARSLLGCPHRPPLSPASFPGQKQAFSAPLTHEAEIFFREASRRGNPKQRHQRGLSALERKGSAVGAPAVLPGALTFFQAMLCLGSELSSLPCEMIQSIACMCAWPYGTIW